MLLYLHHLYATSHRLAAVAPLTDDPDLEFELRLMSQNAQRLRRQTEERPAVRN